MTTLWRRVLDRCAVVLVAAALGVAAWPITVPTAPSLDPPFSDSPAALPAGAKMRRNDSIRDAVVRGNVFSASRRAPQARYMAPGQARDPVLMASADPSDLPSEDAGTSFPQLLGIVSQDGVLFGMLQVRDSVPPRLVRAGDVLEGVRVRRLTRELIVLSTANGTRTVRLSRDAASDSTGMLP